MLLPRHGGAGAHCTLDRELNFGRLATISKPQILAPRPPESPVLARLSLLRTFFRSEIESRGTGWARSRTQLVAAPMAAPQPQPFMVGVPPGVVPGCVET